MLFGNCFDVFVWFNLFLDLVLVSDGNGTEELFFTIIVF